MLAALVAIAVVLAGVGDLSEGFAIHGPLHVLFGYIPVFFLLFFIVLTRVPARCASSRRNS